MGNIHNFANRQLCEYTSIFPTVAALLDHLLFTIGNGYDCVDGMIVCDHRDGSNQSMRIDEFPEMTDEEWNTLIKECHAKEQRFADEWAKHSKRLAKKYVEENCARYKRISVDDSMFTEESLFKDLLKQQADYHKQYKGLNSYLRPYPLSEKYSDIYHLNENTPVWFLQIAINLCSAWVQFLTNALDIRDVDTDEVDYANAEWTARHRDMLVDLVLKLEGLKFLQGENNGKTGKEINAAL